MPVTYRRFATALIPQYYWNAIYKDLKGRSDQARDYATKTIDVRVKTPVYHAAQGIDQVRLLLPCFECLPVS